jgi:MFS family permease
MLDGMDVMVYSFVLPSLILLWHISREKAGLLGTSALIVSSLGGWLAGLAADRYGRVRVLQVTIVWFAVFTFLSGFTNTFTQLLVVRGLQGLGFGGEWAVGSVLIGETIRAKYRGRAVGMVQGGWSIGWGIAAAFYTIFFAFLPQAIAWRAMFWIGILPALFTVWIRKHVQEPELYLQHRAAKPDGHAAFLRIFSPAYLRITVLTSLVALGAQGGYYAVNTFLPLYLNAKGFSVARTGGSLMVVIAGSFLGYVVSAHLADMLGRKRTLIIFAAGSFLTICDLYDRAPEQRRGSLVRLPGGIFPLRFVQPHGLVLYGAVPYGIARIRPGLRLQLRPRRRSEVSSACGLLQYPHAARICDRVVRRIRLRDHGSQRTPVARDKRHRIERLG